MSTNDSQTLNVNLSRWRKKRKGNNKNRWPSFINFIFISCTEEMIYLLKDNYDERRGSWRSGEWGRKTRERKKGQSWAKKDEEEDEKEEDEGRRRRWSGLSRVTDKNQMLSHDSFSHVDSIIFSLHIFMPSSPEAFSFLSWQSGSEIISCLYVSWSLVGEKREKERDCEWLSSLIHDPSQGQKMLLFLAFLSVNEVKVEAKITSRDFLISTDNHHHLRLIPNEENQKIWKETQSISRQEDDEEKSQERHQNSKDRHHHHHHLSSSEKFCTKKRRSAVVSKWNMDHFP